MKCDFCGKDIVQSTESIYVDAAGKASYFCSRKCDKNMLKLERKPQNVRWTDRYRREKAIRVKQKKPEKPAKKEVETASRKTAKTKPSKEKPAESKAKPKKPEEKE